MVNGGQGAAVFFETLSKAGTATITANGSTVAGGHGVVIYFEGLAGSSAENSTLILNGGSGGGNGAKLYFFESADGGTARVIANAGARVDITPTKLAGISFGSIEGAGTFSIGGKTLTVGSSDLSTTVSATSPTSATTRAAPVRS